MSFAVESLGSLKILFLCPSHVISKPIETEVDNNLNTTNKSETSHIHLQPPDCTKESKPNSNSAPSNRSF